VTKQLKQISAQTNTNLQAGKPEQAQNQGEPEETIAEDIL